MPRWPSADGVEEEEKQEPEDEPDLRSLDHGVPHLRKIKGDLQIAKVKLQRAPYEDPELVKAVQDLMDEKEKALEARSILLRRAAAYVPRPWPASSSSAPSARVAHFDGSPGRRRLQNRIFPKVLVMGMMHSCTNAVAKELEKRFDVEVVNDWHTDKTGPLWKHRVNLKTPRGLTDEMLVVLMVKDPYFWLKSCSRAERNFFEIHPFIENEKGEREDVPPKTLQHLFVPLEHDAIIYQNAVDLWNDTVSSYFDRSVYPPEQSVIARSEDFLFRFHEVMDDLASYGLRERPELEGERPDPLAERAKGHLECRSRDDALRFYGNSTNRRSEFTQEQLDTVARDLDPKGAARLGYGGSDPVSTWSTSAYFLVGSWCDWKDFLELQPVEGGALFRARVSLRETPGEVQFQIVQDRDWKRRFYPGKGATIQGPENAHGTNWRIRIPSGCKALEVTWDPKGARSLKCEYLR